MPNPRTAGATALAAVLLLCAAASGGPERDGPGPRIGVLHGGAPRGEVGRAFAETATAYLPRAAVLERATSDRTAAYAALSEFKIEDVALVVGVGDAAALRAAESVRDRAVVVAGVRFPDRFGGLPHVCGSSAAAPPARLWAEFRRAVPALGTLLVLAPRDDARAVALARALEAGGKDVPGADARRIEAPDAALPVGIAAIYLPASVSAGDAQRVTTRLAGRGVPVIGSTREHLDAGCAIVIRASLRNAGVLAVVQARAVIAGKDPSAAGVRPVRRILREVNLPAARRLGYDVPLPFLAAADHVVPALADRR